MTMIDSVITTKRELTMFRDCIDAFLPDTPGGNDYVCPWEDDDLVVVGKLVATAIDRILQTQMHDHCAFELLDLKRAMGKAVKDHNITNGQQVLKKVMHEFELLWRVCREFQRIHKEMN